MFFYKLLCLKKITASLKLETFLFYFILCFEFFPFFNKPLCFFMLCFVQSFYQVLLSHAILVGNLLRQNSLRIRKSTLYFLLTCLERAHSCLNRRASRIPVSILSISSISFLILPPYMLYSRICSDLQLLRYI